MKANKFKTKILFFLFFLPVLALVIFVFINLHIILSTKKYIVPSDSNQIQDVDCILVLGARVMSNGVPSHILEDRLLTGIELYKNGVSGAILMSGDNGQKYYNEVQAMKNYAVNLGIPESSVFMDHAGFSTYDSCYRARDVFCVKKVVIVTQQYHLYRAVYMARFLGIDAYGVSSDRRIISGQGKRDFREFFARIKAMGALLVKAKPKYLGKPIPIN